MWESKKLYAYAKQWLFKTNHIDQDTELRKAIDSFGIDHGDDILKWLFKYDFLKIQCGFAWDGDKESLKKAIEAKKAHFKIEHDFYDLPEWYSRIEIDNWRKLMTGIRENIDKSIRQNSVRINHFKIPDWFENISDEKKEQFLKDVSNVIEEHLNNK